MESFPEDVRFRLTWRPYQARVLSELEEHLDDNKLHVVAAPGSGKTILGLEVVCRINKPTVVLAPTLAIRDQWIQRFVDFFLPKGALVPNYISRDLNAPGFLTVATYQALHSAMTKETDEEEDSDEEEEEEDLLEEDNDNRKTHPWQNQSKKKQNTNSTVVDLVDLLLTHGIQTLVLDEAHHLRTNWWKSLTTLVNGLKDPKILALTATPPFDVPPAEWDRYMEICGPVDATIPVPELVLQGNLCPHQDLVIFSTPSEAESAEITRFRNNVTLFVRNLQASPSFTDCVRRHSWLNPPEIHIDEILDDAEFFSAMLVYLDHHGVEIPKSATKIVADSKRGIPSLNLEWLEILLTGVLYPKNKEQPKLDPVLETIRDELKRIGALERRRVVLRNVNVVEKILKQSISKLHRIVEIVHHESETLGKDLRMVVLTDYIRKAFLPTSLEDRPALSKIGVIPIFEALRRDGMNTALLGILSGSMVVIPHESQEIFNECAIASGIETKCMQLQPLIHDNRYLTVSVPGPDHHKLVRAITDLFTIGGVNVLIGTKSLLGEGWDAPSINSLVIASFVGSYMLSNQMRGRAIRSEKGNPEKTANIWHIICVEPKSELPGEDYLTMQRRFKAFVGVSSIEPIIENSFDRLGIGKPPFEKKQVERFNAHMFKLSSDRVSMRQSWEKALHRGEEGIRLVEDVQAQKTFMPRGFVFQNTISALFWQGIFITCYFISEFLHGLPPADSLESLYLILAVLLICCIVIITPTTVKAVWLFIKHGPVKSSMKQIGIVVLKTLSETGEVTTAYNQMRVVVEEQKHGTVLCHIEGGNNREKSVYLHAFQEVLNPIENPRYILVRKSALWNLFTRKDYHAVPSVIGARKEYAEFFAKMWSRYVGKMELIYTRNRHGRILLLKARNNSLSSTFRPRSERITRWK